MNLRDLKYFLAVAELRHFGQAAERCHVSQPTLSGQIKKLEDTLGVTLLERTNRRVMLTDVGRRIAASAERILAEEKTIYQIARNAQNPLAGELKIGAFPTLAPYIFPKLVPQVRCELPEVRLILIEEKTETLVVQLRNGELDAALLALPIVDDTFDKELLFDDPFYLAVSREHPLAERTRVQQSEMVDFELLLLDEGHCLRDQALQLCQGHGVNAKHDFRATSLETLRLMVKAGTGVTLIPQIAGIKSGSDICYVPFADPQPCRQIALFWRKTSPRRGLMDSLVEMLSTGHQTVRQEE